MTYILVDTANTFKTWKFSNAVYSLFKSMIFALFPDLCVTNRPQLDKKEIAF